MGQTIAEKIFSRTNTAGTSVKAGDLIDANLDGVMAITWNWVRDCFKKMGFDGPPLVWDNDRFFLMVEHNQPPTTVQAAKENQAARNDATRLELKHFYDSEMGICHQMMVDYGHVRPGELIAGNDSHTVAHGALNAAGTGVGSDEIAYALTFGQLFFTVPETIKVNLHGKPSAYPFGKDIIMYLAGKYGDSFAQNRAIEFHGPLASAMSMANRLTLADHAVEVGGKFGFFLADDKCIEFVKQYTDKPFQTVEPDADAAYAREIDVDFDEIGFQIAKPWRFDNVGPVTDAIGVKIDQARIGSCANGRFEDIEVAARILKGKHVAPGVRFYVSPASMTVYKQCADAGIVSTLVEAGVHFMNPGCSICQAPSIVLNEETCITSTTRNYHGRFGGSTCADAQLYLASPATVAAAALAGHIIDPREVL